MRRIFYLIARITNYSTAVAIITSIMISFILVTEIFILNFFLGQSGYAYSAVIALMDLPYNYIVPIALILQLSMFGFFSRIKIPAFFRFLREINNNVKGRKLNPDISDENLLKLYNHLTNIPIYNTLISLIFLVIMGMLIYTIGYFNLNLGTYDKEYADIILGSFIEYIQINFILHGFVVIIAALLTYVLTDSMTNRERATCYHELWKRNYFNPPKSYFKLRVKFNVIIVLIIISLSCFLLLITQKKLYLDISLSGFIIYFLASIFAATSIIIITANSILRIFRDINRVAQDITKGMEANFKILPLEGEFADVEYLILSMDKEIIEHRRNLEAKVAERTEELRIALADLKERDDMVQKQLDMAGTIQRGILPGKINDWNELKFSVRYFSMDKIGGDFYDVQPIGNNKIALYVADASGHGIPAALVTTMAKVSFGNAFLKYDSPKRIFKEVNKELLEHIKTQEYLTCFMVLIDDEYNVTYSNASHQKALILRTSEGKIEYLDTGGLFIGAIEDARETYEEKITKLNYGDRLILYTDGIPEALNPARETYSNERFGKIILQNKELQLKNFTDSIIEDLQNFITGKQIQDDITLLVIELYRDRTIDIIRNVKNLNEKKRYFEAIDLLKKGLEQYPDNQKLLYNLAKSYFMANDFKLVIESIEKYIQKESGNKYAYYLAGAAYFKIMDYDTAIEFFQKALNIDSNFVNALFAMGMAYKGKDQKDEASRYFEKIKKIDEDNKMAEYELSTLK